MSRVLQTARYISIVTEHAHSPVLMFRNVAGHATLVSDKNPTPASHKRHRVKKINK